MADLTQQTEGAGTALEAVASTPAPAPLGYSAAGLISDSEITSLWRVASSLAKSSLFKDVTQAEQAFAKMIVGRDLGLTPAQSMTLYVMEGKIEVPYPLLAHFIRSRPGYDFTVQWREQGVEGWLDEESGEREITGCRITVLIGGEQRAVSIWTKADSERAGLEADRGSKRSNHLKYPRNMYLARAMSNLVKFHVPEVLNGLPVYAEGELPRPAEIGAGQGSGEPVGWKGLTITQTIAVEQLMDRAKMLGHAGLSKREVMEQRLNGQAPPDIDRLIASATAELDALEAEIKARVEQAIEDADVVPDAEPESDADRAARLEREALALLSSADGVEEEDPERAEELRAEAAAKHDLAVAAGDPDQTTLPEM
jgi:hypothetical protein